MIAPDRFAPGMARQLERLAEALASGMPRRGWKIGINVPEVLRHLELPHSSVGWLDGQSILPAGAELPIPSGARLHAEPEVAIRLARPVAPGDSAGIARGCIDAVHPALEIVDYERPGSGLDDIVAHCMFHHATVLGSAAPPEAARDLGRAWPVLRIAGQPTDPPRPDLVPADLGELVAFVADYLGAFDQVLEPDDLILSGSYLAKASALEAGVEAVAEFGPLGSVSAKLAD